MADLKSQAVKQLPLKPIIGSTYSKIIMQRIIDDQTTMIKALQEDVKNLDALTVAMDSQLQSLVQRVTTLEGFH